MIKTRSSRALKFLLTGMIMISIVLWLSPVNSISADPQGPPPLPPGVDAWIQSPFNCPTGCANEIRIPVGGGSFANGDYGDGTLLVSISGYGGGTGDGFSWSTNRPICYLIVKLDEEDWARGYNTGGATSGTWTGVPETGIGHVSFCYADVPTCEGQLTIVKHVGGAKPAGDIGTFEFFIQPGSDTPTKFQLTFPDYEYTFYGIKCGNYNVWEDEATIPAGYEFESIQTTIGSVGGSGNNVVSLTMTDGGSGIVTINNQQATPDTTTTTAGTTTTTQGTTTTTAGTTTTTQGTTTTTQGTTTTT